MSHPTTSGSSSHQKPYNRFGNETHITSLTCDLFHNHTEAFAGEIHLQGCGVVNLVEIVGTAFIQKTDGKSVRGIIKDDTAAKGIPFVAYKQGGSIHMENRKVYRVVGSLKQGFYLHVSSNTIVLQCFHVKPCTAVDRKYWSAEVEKLKNRIVAPKPEQ